MLPGTEIEIEAVADGVLVRSAVTALALVLEGDVLVHRGELASQINVAGFMRQQRTSRVRDQGHR